MTSVAGEEYVLEMCQQLDCCMRIQVFPLPVRGNSFSLDFIIKGFPFFCLRSKLAWLVTDSEMFQCNRFWVRQSALLPGVMSLDNTVRVSYSSQVLDATLAP